ncbi:MAG: 3-phosphoshikimate 1-carboxyvinyltransferase [Saccharofermentanales bacterium]
MPDSGRSLTDASDIFIASGKLVGSIRVPQSKSIAHRAVICSALSRLQQAGSLPQTVQDRADRIDTGPGSGLSLDISATRMAMTDILNGSREIFCSESGSTLRFLIPVAAALGRSVVFRGAGRLPERPLVEYRDALGDKGVCLEFPSGEGVYLPLRISGRLSSGIFRIPGNVSSQYVSGLLLALPLLEGDSRIDITSELESEAYIDLTIGVMEEFGVSVSRLGTSFLVPGGQQYEDTDYKVEGDYSQAAFWLTANLLGSDIRLSGLRPDSRQGDRCIGDILEIFRRCREDGSSADSGIEIDASQIPDLVPIICVAAANTPAVTRIVKAGRLRLKESDRIASSAALIRSIGGIAEETPDGIVITGSADRLRGGRASSFGDHRIAMAAAIAATATEEGVTIADFKCVDKSYPEFFEDMKKVEGAVYGFNIR